MILEIYSRLPTYIVMSHIQSGKIFLNNSLIEIMASSKIIEAIRRLYLTILLFNLRNYCVNTVQEALIIILDHMM